jgi:ankyrin repeat protein
MENFVSKKLVLALSLSALFCQSSHIWGASETTFLKFASHDVGKMFAAVFEGDLDAFKSSIAGKKAIINETALQPDGAAPGVLHYIMQEKDCRMLSHALSRGADWSKGFDFRSGYNQYAPIWAAAKHQSPAMVDCFLRAGMPLDYSFEGITILEAAAQEGCDEMVRHLLTQQAYSGQAHSGEVLADAACVAARQGQLGVIKVFCELAPVVLMMRSDEEGERDSVLLSAIRASKKDVAEHLLLSGAPLDISADGTCVEQEEARRIGNEHMMKLIDKHKDLQRVFNSEPQASTKSNNKKKKKKKKKKPVAQDMSAPQEALDSIEQDGDSAALARWNAWHKELKQAGLAAREEEVQEKSAVRRAQEQVEINRKERERLERVAQEKEQAKKNKSAELVQALQNFSADNTAATRAKVRDLIERKKYALYGQDAKEYALEYDNAYSVLYPETAKQKQIKAAPTSAGPKKQAKQKSAGAGAHKNGGQKNPGQSHGAGRKANKQEKKSHIPAQWAPTERLPKAAPSIYDRLLHAGYVEDDGRPKQQVGDYAPEQTGVDDGGAVQAYSDGGDQYPAEFAQVQDGGDIQDGGQALLGQLAAYQPRAGYQKLNYGHDELWVNMQHILVGDVHGGGHFDNEDKSCFQHWIKTDFKNRLERAMQNLDYRGPDTQEKDCIVGVFAPEKVGEIPVPFKGRIATIRGYVVPDPQTGEETLVEDKDGQHISILGTLFPIAQPQYARIIGQARSREEKEDQELSLESWDAYAQISESELDESIWG